MLLSSISQAAYIAKVPLEQSNGGSLPNNSINIGAGGASGGGSGSNIVCNYGGPRSDGQPNYNGYDYHHIEGWDGSYNMNTIWYQNNYITGYSDADLANSPYSRGRLMATTSDPNRNYYELCVDTSGTS